MSANVWPREYTTPPGGTLIGFPIGRDQYDAEHFPNFYVELLEADEWTVVIVERSGGKVRRVSRSQVPVTSESWAEELVARAERVRWAGVSPAAALAIAASGFEEAELLAFNTVAGEGVVHYRVFLEGDGSFRAVLVSPEGAVVDSREVQGLSEFFDLPWRW